MNFDWIRGFVIDFDKNTGMSNNANSTKRYLSDMKNMYADGEAYNKLITENPLIYEYYVLDTPHDSGDIAAGTSIVYPGKIGNEYHMTKGHFHTILMTAEIYYTLSGEGYMLTENKEGDVIAHKLEAGKMVYVPKGYAHRSINVGNEPLVTFFAFRADAGHDYGTIEKMGYRKLIVEQKGTPTIIDNPKWGM